MVRIDSLRGSNLYVDLIKDLIKNGNKIYIANPSERRHNKNTHLIKGENYEILKIKTLNLQKTNVIEKGIGQLLMEYQFEAAINKYWNNVKFDLILYSTPPITFNKVIEKLKKRDNARAYLMLKDIFPQNAIDLGMMKKDSFLYKMFRKKETKLYSISDKIGCMSPANIDFIIKNNPDIEKTKLELCPNSIEIKKITKPTKSQKDLIFNKYSIPTDKVVSIYGGNLGKPQGIDFLIEVLEENENLKNNFIIIIGSGTEYSKLKKWFDEIKPLNSKLISILPKEEYDWLVQIADIGLIFLDHRFTIPNFPSRILNYLECSLPILFATDPITDVGKIADENSFGFWSESNDLNGFMNNLKKLVDNKSLREEMGKRGRNFLINNYSVENTSIPILKFARKKY